MDSDGPAAYHCVIFPTENEVMSSRPVSPIEATVLDLIRSTADPEIDAWLTASGTVIVTTY